MEQKLVLNILHLSDIHFKYQLEGTIHDLDHDVRNELAIDVKRLTRQTGQVSAIVVTGDVAFAGKAADYDVAKTWLASLCKEIGCEIEHVWVVPGNHDIDRAGITEFVRTAQNSIQETTLDKIDRRIRQFVHEDPIGEDVLKRPLTEYYKFSSIYGCRPEHGSLSWDYELKLDMGYSLKLIGLNSALVSNENDDKTNRPLVLGQAQLNLPRRQGRIYVSLCHHPVSWLKDGDNVHEKLCSRASLQLFGHEHDQALQRVGNSLIVQAGALQPDREEEGSWCPAYNVLTLAAVSVGTDHCLSVTAYPRVWCQDHCFASDPALNGKLSQEFMLPLDEEIRIPKGNGGTTITKEMETAPRILADTGRSGKRERTMVNPVRQLAYAFLTLPYTTQMRIANQLELLEEEDVGLDCATLFKRVFERAQSQQGLEALWDSVSGAQGEVATMPNPYRPAGDREGNHHG